MDEILLFVMHFYIHICIKYTEILHITIIHIMLLLRPLVIYFVLLLGNDLE